MDKLQIVLATLVVYKLILVGIGIWASKRTKNNQDFFLGGRGLGPFVAALSYSSSNASAWTLLGLSGIAYSQGVSTIWIPVGTIAAMIVVWFWVAPRLTKFSRDADCITLTEVITHGAHGKFKRPIIWLASIILVFSYIVYVAAQFQGAGNMFSSSFAMPRVSSIALGATIVMVYTLLGGFWAVSVTDAIQGMLMAFTALVLPVAAFFAVGGYDGLIQGLANVGNPQFFSFTAQNVGWAGLGFVFGGLAFGLGMFGQPHLMVRIMALRDDKALRQARWIAVVWFLLVFLGMWFVGIVGHILHAGLENSESIFFVMLDSLFSPVLAAIFLAAVLSAIMSTADSQLLACASAIAHDLGMSKGDNKKLLLISRLTIVGLVIAAVLLTIFLPEKIFSRVLFAWIALGAAFGPSLLARLMGITIEPLGILLSMLGGFSLTVILSLVPATAGGIAERIVPFVVAGIIVAILREPTSKAAS